MKNKIIALLSFIMLLSLTGCSSSQENVSEKVIAAFENNGFTMYFDDWNNDYFYDIKGNIYTREFDSKSFPGEIIKSARISYEPTSLTLEMHNDGGESFRVDYTSKNDSSNDKETTSVMYYNKDNERYHKTIGDVSEERVLFDRGYAFDEPYIYYLVEDEDSSNFVSDDDILGESAKSDAIKVRESFQESLKKLDISENDLFVFAEWVATNIVEDVLEIVQDTFNNQEVLPAAEVARRFEELDYSVYSDEDGTLVSFDYLRSEYTLYGTEDFVMFAEYEDDIEVFFLLEDGKEKFATPNRAIVYDIEKGETEGNQEMPDDLLGDARYLQYIFQRRVILQLGITQEDLIAFFAEHE